MGDLLSPVHIVLLLIVALLVFGPKRLPEIGSGLGRAIREFRGAMSGVMDEPGKPPTYPMSYDATGAPNGTQAESPNRPPDHTEENR
jgi:sec-independent protein translocase protein TatA